MSGGGCRGGFLEAPPGGRAVAPLELPFADMELRPADRI
jgi:hypothetical protein